MSRVVYLKYGDQVEQARTTGSGALNVKRISKLFDVELDPDSVKLNGISEDVDSSYNTTADVLGGTQDAPILVSGRQKNGKHLLCCTSSSSILYLDSTQTDGICKLWKVLQPVSLRLIQHQ